MSSFLSAWSELRGSWILEGGGVGGGVIEIWRVCAGYVDWNSFLEVAFVSVE